MAVVSGRITHDGAGDFLGTRAGTTLSPGGALNLTPSADGSYSFFGSYQSQPIDFTAVEATSVGVLNYRRVVFPMETGKTLGLWTPKAGSGLLMTDDAVPGRSATLSNASMWISGGTTPFNVPDLWALLMKGSSIDFGPGDSYPSVSPLSLDMALVTNSIGAGQQGADPSRNVVYTLGNMSSGGGFQLQVTPCYNYYNYNNGTYGWAWGYNLVTASLMTEGGLQSVTVKTSPDSPYGSNMGPFNGKALYGASWDGSKLSVTATDGTTMCTNSMALPASAGAVLGTSYANLTCSASANGIWNINPYAMLFGARASNYAVTPTQLKNAMAAFNSGAKVFFQTRSAAVSGSLGLDPWTGGPADSMNSVVSTFETLAEVARPKVSAVPCMTSDTAPSGAAFGSSNQYPAWRAFNGSLESNSEWATQSVATAWIGYDFGLGNAKNLTGYAVAYSVGSPTYAPSAWTFEGSNDNASWTVLDTQTGQTGWTSYQKRTFSFVNADSYRYHRLNMTANNGGNIYVVGELEMYEPVGETLLPMGPGMSVAMDTQVTRTSDVSLRLTGTAASEGGRLAIRVAKLDGIPVSDFLQASMRCDNPKTVFRLKLYTVLGTTPPIGDTTAWSYEFTLGGATEWKDLFFPDWMRTALAAPKLTSYYWLTLEIVQSAGGFNLWLDDMRFRTGLKPGEQIQSPFRSWFQYRTLLLTTV